MKRTLKVEHILIFSIRVRAEIRVLGPRPLLEQSPLLELLGNPGNPGKSENSNPVESSEHLHKYGS
jgi:hypothetical protein